MPFPSEEEVERLLALPPPLPSPLISLSPPSAEERSQWALDLRCYKVVLKSCSRWKEAGIFRNPNLMNDFVVYEVGFYSRISTASWMFVLPRNFSTAGFMLVLLPWEVSTARLFVNAANVYQSLEALDLGFNTEVVDESGNEDGSKDVIGIVIGIGDVVQVNSNLFKSFEEQLSLKMLNTIAVHNALFVTNIYIKKAILVLVQGTKNARIMMHLNLKLKCSLPKYVLLAPMYLCKEQERRWWVPSMKWNQ
ncbi:hypothetical protein Tco_0982649 [Tanacetum coccineum]